MCTLQASRSSRGNSQNWPACLASLQNMCSILMLEAVNYIEHYGLQRAKLPSGRCVLQAAGGKWPSGLQRAQRVCLGHVRRR